MNSDMRKKCAGTPTDAPRYHFLTLVEHGRHAACSSGAKRARRIALAIVEDVPGLDSEAVEGLKDFVDLVVAMPGTAREMVDNE